MYWDVTSYLWAFKQLKWQGFPLESKYEEEPWRIEIHLSSPGNIEVITAMLTFRLLKAFYWFAHS